MALFNTYDAITNPKTRGQQIEGTIRFVLDNDSYYNALSNMPERIRAAALQAFKEDIRGYHVMVLRAALNELDRTGMIDHQGSIYEMD